MVGKVGLPPIAREDPLVNDLGIWIISADNLFEVTFEFGMSTMISPACRRRPDFSIFDVYIRALLDEEFDERSVTVKRRVVQTSA